MGCYKEMKGVTWPEDFPKIDGERLTAEVNKLFRPYLFFHNERDGRRIWSSCCSRRGFKDLSPIMNDSDMYLLYGEHNNEALCPWCGRRVTLKNTSRLGKRKI